VICMDNSEFVRNSDYAPTRLQAEADAVNLLAGAKTQNNPESSVGILSLAGKVPRVLVTPTNDLGKVLNSVHGITIQGEINLITGIQVAHLALKHRQNKHQRMRIVIFIGSPVLDEEKELLKVGRKLKKCNVAIDIVSFGSCKDNERKLDSLLSTVNKNENSHLINVPRGQSIADTLIATHIFHSSGLNMGSGFAAAAAAANVNTMSGAETDLGEDPALMLALRASLEEERVRQENQGSLASKEENSDVHLKTDQTDREVEANNGTVSPNHDILPQVSKLSHGSTDTDSKNAFKDESGSEDEK
jgi:26S proteasome regulatory subunit N10